MLRLPQRPRQPEGTGYAGRAGQNRQRERPVLHGVLLRAVGGHFSAGQENRIRLASRVGPCCPTCGPVSGLAGRGRENTRLCTGAGRVGPVWAWYGKILISRENNAVQARSKSKREKMQGLLLHPCMVHRARQCRSLREFSDFRARKQKGVAKFVFREKWGCKPDKRRYSAKYSGVAPPEGSVARFRYQRTNINSRYGSTRTRWQRLRSCTGRMIAAVNLSSSKRQFGFILAVSAPRIVRPIFPTPFSPT